MLEHWERITVHGEDQKTMEKAESTLTKMGQNLQEDIGKTKP